MGSSKQGYYTININNNKTMISSASSPSTARRAHLIRNQENQQEEGWDSSNSSRSRRSSTTVVLLVLFFSISPHFLVEEVVLGSIVVLDRVAVSIKYEGSGGFPSISEKLYLYYY